MNLTRTHRDFLLREQVIIPIAANFALNALAAWLIFRGLPAVPVWGASGLWGDTVTTLFVLPFATCLIVTPLIRRGVLLGRVPSVIWRSSQLGILRWMPRRTAWRGVLLGMLTVCCFGPLSTLGIYALHAESLPLADAVLLKAAIGGVVGGAVTPLVALYALGAAPLQAPAAHAGATA